MVPYLKVGTLASATVLVVKLFVFHDLAWGWVFIPLGGVILGLLFFTAVVLLVVKLHGGTIHFMVCQEDDDDR